MQITISAEAVDCNRGRDKNNTLTLQYGLPGYGNSVEKIKCREWDFISSPLINHAGTHVSTQRQLACSGT